MFRFTTSASYAKVINIDNQSSFLGRGRLIYEFYNLLQNHIGSKYAFSGLYRNGKTSLFHEIERLIDLSEKKNEIKSLVAFISLQDVDPDEQQLLSTVIDAIDSKIRAFLTDFSEIDTAYSCFKNAKTNRLQLEKAEDYLKALFAKGIRIILFIDEFQVLPDYVAWKYQELANLHHIELLTIAYIGRLPFDVTVKSMSTYPNKGADLPIKQKTVPGFADDDIEEFYNVFLEQYDYDIKEYMDTIFYQCGRSPYLYAYLGEALQEKLSEEGQSHIDNKWIEHLFASRIIQRQYYENNIQDVLKNDIMGDMDNYTRLQRIMIGPRIGIRKQDMMIMEEMGYIEKNDVSYYAVTPYFLDWLRSQEITGELPTKIVDAEKLLTVFIRSKRDEIVSKTASFKAAANVEIDDVWTEFDKAIIKMELMKIPENKEDISQYGQKYTLESSVSKYRNYIVTEREKNHRPVDLLDVLLVKDKLGLLTANWDLFSAYLGSLTDWKDKLISWCLARNPDLHANVYLTEREELECERGCDDILRTLRPLFPNV